MPHSDECRARMDELMQRDEMQRDEDALVQQRLHADRLKRGSMTPGPSGDTKGSRRRNGRIRPAGREWRRCTPSGRGRRAHENSGRRCGHETSIEKINRITT